MGPFRVLSRPGSVGRRRLTFTLTVAGLGLLTGCGGRTQHTVYAASRQGTGVLVVVIDPTASSQEGRTSFCEDLANTIPRLARTFDVQIIHACVRPHIWPTRHPRTPADWRAVFRAAQQPCPCAKKPVRQYCGSNPYKAMVMAQRLLSEVEGPNARKVVVGYLDGINDPCRSGAFAPSRDLRDFRWTTKDAEVFLYGIPEDAHGRHLLGALQSAWKPQTKALHLRYPNVALNVDEVLPEKKRQRLFEPSGRR